MLKKVPAIQKTGDEVEDLKREGQRDDLMELLQLVWRHPERINPALNFVRKLGRRTDDAWALHPPSLLSQVPKGEVVVFLADRGFNADTIDGIMCTDDGFVIKLFCLLLHAPPTLAIPGCLQQNSAAFWRWVVARVHKVGRAQHCKTAFAAGGFRKDVGGAYKIRWQEGKAVSVTHTATGDIHEIGEEVAIDATWSMQNWHSDFHCTVSCGRVLKVYLHEFFKPSRGPNTLLITKPIFEQQATEYLNPSATELACQPPAPASSACVAALSKSRQLKADAVSAKAKESLKNHRAKNAQHLTIALGRTT